VEQAIADKDAITLNQVAWGIVDPEAKVKKRGVPQAMKTVEVALLDIAMKAAAKAVEFTREQNGAMLDTLARVWFWKQNYDKALELETRAYAVARRKDIKKTIAEYQSLVDKTKGEVKQAGK
jgi:hypothetical protein